MDNQKNGWKGVCMYHESNGNAWHCPAPPPPLHIATSTFATIRQTHITNEDASKALKAGAMVLEYPTAKGIPINRIDTHLL